MFVDEIKGKLGLSGGAPSFCATLIGRVGVYVSGVKTVILCGQNEIKLSVKGGALEIVGEGLKIREIGGGDVFVEGEVNGVEIKNKK